MRKFGYFNETVAHLGSSNIVEEKVDKIDKKSLNN